LGYVEGDLRVRTTTDEDCTAVGLLFLVEYVLIYGASTWLSQAFKEATRRVVTPQHADLAL